MIAALTTLRVHGVPIQSRATPGLDSPLSIVQNAWRSSWRASGNRQVWCRQRRMMAMRVLAHEKADLRAELKRFAAEQEAKVTEDR